ncbi:MAG: proteasome regulatory particle base subunit [Paramarteilia canceri]
MCSADCLVSFLDSKKTSHQNYALTKMIQIVDSNWHQVAEHLTLLKQISIYSECEEIKMKASLIISKTFYALGETSEALNYALQAGDLFTLKKCDDFETSIATEAITRFITNVNPEANIANFVLKILHQTLQTLSDNLNNENKSKVGLEILGILVESDQKEIIINYISNLLKNNEIAATLVFEYTVEMLFNFFSESKPNLHSWLRKLLPIALNMISSINLTTLFKFLAELGEISTLEESISKINQIDQVRALQLAAIISYNMPSAQSFKFLSSDLNPKITSILNGTVASFLDKTFLVTHSHIDYKTLKSMKDSSRSSLTLLSVVIAASFVHYGTFRVKFWRDNIDWMSRLSCWSCFGALAGLGHVFANQKPDTFDILETYLPSKPSSSNENSQQNNNNKSNRKNPSSNNFSDSGAFFALGVANAFSSESNQALDYLLEWLEYPDISEIQQYGISLGAGLAAAGSYSKDTSEKLKPFLFGDTNLLSMASAISIGLIHAGSGASAQEESIELMGYGIESQHEKIKLGCGLGQALIVAGKPECLPLDQYDMNDSETQFYKLSTNLEPLVRISAINCMAAAYAATQNSQVISKLLHFISHDVSDLVKQTACQALGFVLAKPAWTSAEIVSESLEIFHPLIVHHNPHVRFGSCLALAICFMPGNLLDDSTKCSVLALLKEVLLHDSISFVKQSAAIAVGMLLNGQNGFSSDNQKSQQNMNNNSANFSSEYKFLREYIYKKATTSDQSMIFKFGACISFGIMNAGGQNVEMSLFDNYGLISLKKLSGLLLFSQYWHWMPLIHFLPLSFSSAYSVIVDQNLSVLDIDLNVRTGSLPIESFDYLKSVKFSSLKSIDSVHSAVLSFVKNRYSSSSRSLSNQLSNLSSKSREKKKSSKEETNKKLVTIANNEFDKTNTDLKSSLKDKAGLPEVVHSKKSSSNSSKKPKASKDNNKEVTEDSLQIDNDPKHKQLNTIKNFSRTLAFQKPYITLDSSSFKSFAQIKHCPLIFVETDQKQPVQFNILESSKSDTSSEKPNKNNPLDSEGSSNKESKTKGDGANDEADQSSQPPEPFKFDMDQLE